MRETIIGLHEWFETPAGRYLLEWERARMDAAVADIFGYHALQLGLPELDALQGNRMPHQWLASGPEQTGSAALAPELQGLPRRAAALQTDFSALPFSSSSLDLVVLPHTLEFSDDPHATLREVERVLVPEGRVVIAGLNPTSLWGLQQRRNRVLRSVGLNCQFLPQSGQFIGPWRLRDWLHLLSFEVELHEFGCYRPGLQSDNWLRRLEWMDGAGARWWPIFGAAYFLVAVKRVRGMRLLGPPWKSAAVKARPRVALSRRRNAFFQPERKD